jgi:hypothetical protein
MVRRPGLYPTEAAARRKAGTDQGTTVEDRGRGNSRRVPLAEARKGRSGRRRERETMPSRPLSSAELRPSFVSRALLFLQQLGGPTPERLPPPRRSLFFFSRAVLTTSLTHSPTLTRLKLTMGRTGSQTLRGTNARSRARKSLRKPSSSTPIWQEILKIVGDIPHPDLAKLPTDLAANHDHYLYGSRRP